MRTIYQIDPDTGAQRAEALAWVAEADPAIAVRVLAAPVGDDTRSPLMWFRLQNGDLVLGVFPCGEMYLATEVDPNRP